jgi:PAS domain S-box-containing protein
MSAQHERAESPDEINAALWAALQASEEHYRNTVELNPHVPWTADPQGNVLEFNQRWLDLTGLTREALERDGWTQVVHPEDLPAMAGAWSHSLQSGDPYDAEHRIRLTNGEFRWMRSRAFPKRDALGQIVRWYGATEDIHERWVAEEALRRREALHWATIDTMAEGVIVLDAEGKVLTLNPAFAAMHGHRSLEEAYERLWHFEKDIEAEDEEGRPIARDDWPGNRAGRGETVHRLTLRSTNRITGHSFVGSYSAVPVFTDGKPAYVVITIHDLTELMRAQEAQRRQAHLLDTVEQAVMVTDLAGTITYWNGYAERLYGWAASEAVGHSILDITPAETTREQAAAILARLSAGQSWAGEFLVRRRDGSAFPAWVTDTPIRDEQGALVGVIGVSTDLTPQKQVEAALRETEERLRQRVDELAEADRQKDEFLALLSHELRNPLAGITTSLYLLERLGSQAQRPRELRQLIVRQTQYLSRLLEDLLDVTRLTRGLIELRCEPTDLRDILRQASEATQSLLDLRHHRLLTQIAPEPLLVDGDPVRLEQVLVNLLTNAAKYTEEHGEIRVTAARIGHEIVLSVRDTGVGIDAALLPRVFDLFTQADRSHARTHGGLGIGLTLVKRIVEMHGGTVAAESAGLGHGSQFTIRFPLSAAALPVAAPHVPVGERPTRRRVLVIEDNRDAADTLRDLLELAGHTVDVAYSGTSGVRAARTFAADVILCDIGLPGMDGYAVARELHTQGILGATQLIAITGFGQPEDHRRTAEAGFHAHLTKPADPEELLRLIVASPVE